MTDPTKGSQTAKILRHFKYGGKLTATQAWMMYGSTRLAARVKDLEHKGHKIERETIKVDNASVKRYWMETK